MRSIDLPGFAGQALAKLPWCHRVLLENLLRQDHIAIAEAWLRDGAGDTEIEIRPTRVLMHDTTCGPALVDIAAARSVLAEQGGDPAMLNPTLRVDVSTDHSVAVDRHAAPDALAHNMAVEIARNRERFALMKWAASALANVVIHPPGTGIMHTLNLERLAEIVSVVRRNGEDWLAPDLVVGTDSHTPMINGIGVLGWGVGGLEAESVMFGMPIVMRVPDVVGVRLAGRLPDGVLAADLALTLTETLRAIPLAGRFLEFFGPGVAALSAGERATIANMAPEYGATTACFPIDGRTLDYLRQTARPQALIETIEAYAKRQGLWFDPDATPAYQHIVEFDLNAVTLGLSGPRRPQDRQSPEAVARSSSARIAIAAITSCTNTSDPRQLIAAGLLARKARVKGLRPQPWVKTSLAPGSPVAQAYLRRSGLLDDLEALGFGIVGFGCTTCVGNSGGLIAEMENPAAVISGNRNFPGRVHPAIETCYLASPPMVVAYALAGALDGDLRLAELWPSGAEIDAALSDAHDVSDYEAVHAGAERNAAWRALDAPETVLYPWDPGSTYVRRPPFAALRGRSALGVHGAHPLLVLGDDITTDHISPAGAIAAKSEAGRHLVAHGADPKDLNVFSARRGNWEVMVRGLFTNASVRNLLAPDLEPGWTIHAGSGDQMTLWEAARRYADEGRAVVVLAGDRYGMGSSRDWAAKGLALLGVRAVLATGFETIHRSNLINMGIVPLILPGDCHPTALGLTAGDEISIAADPERFAPRCDVRVRLGPRTIAVRAAVETRLEVRTLIEGGMLPMTLRRLMEREGRR